MKKNSGWMIGASAMLMALPQAANAQNVSADELAAMRAEIAALRAQIATLEARVNTVETAPAPAPVPAPVVAEAKPAKPSTEIAWKGAPEFKHPDGWSFKPRGRIQMDVGNVDAPDGLVNASLGFNSRVRRIRLGAEGTMPGGFGYKIEADFAGGNAEFADAFLTYTDGGLKVTLGQHDNFQGIERVSTTNVSSFMERASFNEAFNFERKMGASVAYTQGPWLAQAGVFTDAFSDLTSDLNNAIGVDGRLVYAPKIGAAQLHLAGSAHWRQIGDNQPTTRYRSRPQIRTTDVRFIATPTLVVDSETDYGLEAALISGRFHTSAEAHWLTAKRPGLADPTFFGASWEAGLYLTDDTRAYGGGMFRPIKVKNPVGSGGLGAWQVNARYDHLDLSDAGIVGGTQDGLTASLIWTPIDYVRFILNYSRLEYDNSPIAIGVDRDYAVDSMGMRAQISF